MLVKELLEALDGSGLVVTDLDLIQETLKENFVVGLDSEIMVLWESHQWEDIEEEEETI